MRSKITLLMLLIGTCFAASAQQNQLYDNTNYRALYLSEAVKLINTTPNLLLLDVRSPGEYADTSQYTTLNIGRLKGSRNISIDSIVKHMHELKVYKDRPILVYCSHSQRSRQVSKFLADSGFKQVYSLNGGMSLVNRGTDKEFALKSKLYTTSLPYKLIEGDDAYRFIQNKNDLLIDVRPKEQFDGADTTEANNIGRIRNAVNIPLKDIDTEVNKLSNDKARPILLYGMGTGDGVEAAKKFVHTGYKNVSVLFEGLSTFLPNTPRADQGKYFTGLPKYKVLGAKETIDLVNARAGLLIADMRSQTEFTNKDKMNYHNLGHVRNAQNYTWGGLQAYLKGKPKNTPVLVYGSSMPGQNVISANEVSKHLAAEGYQNIYLFYGGMYGLMWSVTNMEDCRNGRPILVDHQGLY